jgi:hypothetical protein
VIVAVDDELDRAHVVAVPPETIAKVTAPVPLPPLVVIERACEYGKAFVDVPRDEIDKVLDVAIVKVNVALALVEDVKFASAALVAWIKQVPGVVAVIVAEEEESERAHVVAVPPETMAKVTAPVPFPPLVVIESACEYGKAFVEVPNDEIVNVPEVAMMKVNVALALVAAA